MRKIVFPGESLQIARRSSCTYNDGKGVCSSAVGLFDEERASLLPLEGPWQPRIDETVVGTITDCKNYVYTVNLSYYCRALIIGSRYGRQSDFEIGSAVEAKIKDIEDRTVLILSYPRALPGGILVRVKPAKVHRIIGKEDTMVRQVENLTGTRLVVGANGVIWIKGQQDGIKAAIKAISLIEENAHRQGLTEQVKVILEKEARPYTRNREQREGE